MAEMTYKEAGVDIDSANQAKKNMARHVKSTHGPEVLGKHGSFGGLFKFDASAHKKPVLVSSADGVGTKLKLAYLTGKHDTVGADLVHHCVNDILVMGAKPLFFLDYLALESMDPLVVEGIVKGIAAGCKENGVALVGGETAELPGLYAKKEYDLAGTIVGVVEEDGIIDGSAINEGDVLIGLVSHGLHTNGYTLAMKVLLSRDQFHLKEGEEMSEEEKRVIEKLMGVHKSYLVPVMKLLGENLVSGMAHITGGGMTENIPRVMPSGLAAQIKMGTWTIPQIFLDIQEKGSVPKDDMYRTFNMGIGMVLIVKKSNEKRVLDVLQELTTEAALIGTVVKGEQTKYIP